MINIFNHYFYNHIMSDNTFDLWDIYDSLKKELENSEEENKSICQCGSNNVVEIDSMNICSNCNAIIDKSLDNTAEWRYYGSEDNRDGDPSRCEIGRAHV